jgi:hypothetical protein
MKHFTGFKRKHLTFHQNLIAFKHYRFGFAPSSEASSAFISDGGGVFQFSVALEQVLLQ